MPYSIELMSIGEDLYPHIEAAAEALNSVQKLQGVLEIPEFQFRATPLNRREWGLSRNRSKYMTDEVFAWLKEDRARTGGQRPYIIAFLNGPLSSDRYENLFGSHEADEGLAVCTFHNCTQFVRDINQFCAYYLVRYSLSFVNPSIKSHTDEPRKKCYFHKKIYKPDIRLSMESGEICDPDMRELEKHLDPSGLAALRQMRKFVSGQLPYTLIMKGGGVKGLSFAGALKELEKYYSFDTFVGTSAGAIAAILLGTEYSTSELEKKLSGTDFRQFLDAWRIKMPFNLVFKGGLYPGDEFEQWMDTAIRDKVKRQGEVQLKDFPVTTRTVIYACRPKSGMVQFDSRGEGKDVVASFAARCSMSIPIFFVPKEIAGRRVYDGGMRNNFPVARFLADNGHRPFIALYLGESLKLKKRWIGSELIDIWIGGEELSIVDSYLDSTVVIDPTPIKTTDFHLRENEKKFLIAVGRAAALCFLRDRKLNPGPSAEDITAAKQEVNDLRIKVVRGRRGRQAIKWMVIVLLISFVIAAYFFLLR